MFGSVLERGRAEHHHIHITLRTGLVTGNTSKEDDPGDRWTDWAIEKARSKIGRGI